MKKYDFDVFVLSYEGYEGYGGYDIYGKPQEKKEKLKNQDSNALLNNVVALRSNRNNRNSVTDFKRKISAVVILNLCLKTIETIETIEKQTSLLTCKSNLNHNSFDSYNSFKPLAVYSFNPINKLEIPSFDDLTSNNTFNTNTTNTTNSSNTKEKGGYLNNLNYLHCELKEHKSTLKDNLINFLKNNPDSDFETIKNHLGLTEPKTQALIDMLLTAGLINFYDIQRKMQVVRNTSKRYQRVLSDLGLIRFVSRDGNTIYYKRCQEGVKKGLIGVNFDELKNYFEDVKGVNFTKEQCDIFFKILSFSRDSDFDSLNKKNITALAGENDTLKMTPSNNLTNFLKNNPDSDFEEIKTHLTLNESLKKFAFALCLTATIKA